MAYKLIALDLDNTLLNAQKQITPENREAILMAREKGIRIVLASGRAYPGILPVKKELGLDDYVASCGGAQILNPQGDVIHSVYLPPIAAKQVMRWAALRGVHFQIYLDDGLYYLKRNQYSDYYEKICSYGGEPNPDLLDIETVLTAKIVLIDDEEKLKEYAKELRITFPEFFFTKSQTGLLEVINPEATKERAIAFIAGKLGIEQQQIIAVGDNSIDAGMIAYAGLGVAMGNAPEELKKTANYVCGTCEQSGVAEVIDKYILGV